MPARSASSALMGWIAIALLTTTVVLLATRGAADTAGPAVDVARGETLYAAYCTACHGADGAGRPGQSRSAGPPLVDVDAAYVDLTLRTGRMPLRAPDVGVDLDPRLDEHDADREALVAWMVDAFDLEDSRPPEVVTGDTARGQALYAQHCASCHGATGAGGVSGGEGTLIRPLTDVGGTAAVEAMVVGPFTMPRFGEVLDPEEVTDVAAFVDVLDEQPTTPLGLAEMDRVTMTLLVVPVVLAVLGIVLLAGRRVDVADAADGDGADR